MRRITSSLRWNQARRAALVPLAAVGALAQSVIPAAPAGAEQARATAMVGAGYRILTSDGAVHQFGPLTYYGSDARKLPPGVTAVALASDVQTGGYWILRSDGGVDSFHAPSYGSLQGTLPGRVPVALAESTRGGYLLLTSNGGVHRFGPTPAYGGDAHKLSPGVKALALAVDRKTGGYWILRSDGGIDGFHAPSDGSLRGKLAGTAAAALAAARQGGYYILTSDGAVHPFGPAKLLGSDAGKLPAGVTAVSLATSSSTGGYRILRSDGGVSTFRQARHGSLVGQAPAGTRPSKIPTGTRPSTIPTGLIVLIAVGLGLLLVIAAVLKVVVRRRRLAAEQPSPFEINGARFPAGRDFFRVYRDRVRVALDERGAPMLILGLGLAVTVALAALVAG